MQAFLDILLSLPTVLFTVPMGLITLYWLSVLIGAADLDVGDGLLDGAVDGALDGAVDGALDAAVDGALDGALDGAADGALDGAADAVDAAVDAAEGGAEAGGASGFSVLRWLANALRLGRVPLTISASMWVFGGWCASFILTMMARNLGLAVPALALVVLTGLTSVLVASVFTNLATRPMEPVFRVAHARERNSLVGESCEVATGRVDADFGQASAMIGGDDLLFQVRCDRADNGLRRGDRVLIVSFDKGRDAFVVEPLSSPRSTENRHATRAAASTRSQLED